MNPAQRGRSATDSLHILHAIRSDGFAGVEQFVRRLAISQAASGHSVHVIGGDPAHMRAALGSHGIGFTPATRTLDVALALTRLRRVADVVNTHMTAADVAAALAFGIVPSRPAIVATRHFALRRGTNSRLPIDRAVRGIIDAEISVSAAVAAAIGVGSTVIHPGVEERPAADPSRRTQAVLIAQRLEVEKATDAGIRAFAESTLAARGWTLEIAGEGAERDALEVLVRSLGLGSVTTFLGFRTDLPTLMSHAGILLAPCPFEHFGLSVVEAMASALPVVAADAGGHREMLAGLDPRALFTPGDLAGAAAQLDSLAADAAGRQALGDAQRQRQLTTFSLRSQSEATDRVYRSAIRARRGGEERP